MQDFQVYFLKDSQNYKDMDKEKEDNGFGIIGSTDTRSEYDVL